MRYAMIMAGGSGTRLWPMSRDGQPKQLIKFIKTDDGRTVSLLQLAAERAAGLTQGNSVYICTGERYREQIKSAMPDFDDAHILGEPMPRDTVNAVAFAAAVFAKDDPDAVFSVLTADQLIEPADVFESAVERGYTLVEQDPTRLVTFGITPDHPATGYGYIERGELLPETESQAFKVARFIEKPPLEKAEAYFNSGRFDWNAGMFVFHARTLLDLYKRFMPKNAELIEQLSAAWGTDRQQAVLDEVYLQLEKTSVDYGIMEPAANEHDVTIVGVKMPIQWLDVGSWPAYAQTLKPDQNGNRSNGVPIATFDANNNIVISEDSDADHTIALIGCDDLIVIRTERATLVVPKDRAQDIKKLHELLPDGLK
ncbi:MAG: mannose-1-phosphate guanyltransferase [Phycisphaerae bacterium]|nr:mannose-1-phosphate guanyltransferase [Phycisphaerae bacterium]MBM91756.1 mannose-1-phosphate guanyltransferase [Phycisphaerae bacterium]HCT44901.1 mannose-1-phosphate guanyltransferase [Phycisphaerales bacterium]